MVDWMVVLVVLIGVTTALLGIRYGLWRSKQLKSIFKSSQIVRLPGGEMEFSFTGESTEPVVLYLHGSPGGQDHAITRPGSRVLTPSRPGYLNTPLEKRLSPAEQAGALVELLDYLELDRVTITGASGGGPVALALAALYPERVQRLILIEAVSDSLELREVPGFMRSDFFYWLILGALQRLVGVRGLVRRFIPDPSNSDRVLADPKKLERYAEVLWSVWPFSRREAGWRNDKAQFAELDLDVANIRAPTLIVHGTADVSVPLDMSEKLAKKIPGAELVKFEGADHTMPITHEAELAEVVAQFSAVLR